MADPDEKTLLLKCMECDAEFFTEGESNIYKKKDLHTPKRRKACREKRMAQHDQKLKEKELKNTFINVKIRMYNCDYLRMSTFDFSSDLK